MKLKSMINKNIWRSRSLWVAVFLFVFVILYKPSIVEAIGNLFRDTFNAIKEIQSFQVNLKTPHSGEHVLPPAVQEMLALLKAHQLDSYQVSEQIIRPENCQIYQRIVESAWPRRIDPKGNHKFVLISELDNFPNCVIKERKKEVALVFCP
jgi:hypothetical protein